jgi:hypothetical protein
MKVGARNRGYADMMERVGQRHKNGQKMGGRYKGSVNRANSLANRVKMLGN